MWAKVIVKYFLLFLICTSCFGQDSILVKPSANYEKGAVHNFIFGKHYRSLWSVPIKMEVFNASKEAGGLFPTKVGGGLESTSLRLSSKSGNEYSLRLIVKDPSKAMNPRIKNSYLGKVFKEQNSASNPYAALVVSELSNALGIFHATPKLVYVSNDPGLGVYSDLVANEIALLEERPNEVNADNFKLGPIKKVVGTDAMLKKIYEDNSNQVDQKMYLKCRLFDMLLSDWGRHEDQWKWAVYSIHHNHIYKPIPRDRDHAMYQFDDGLLPWIMIHTVQPKFQSFDKRYKNIKGLNISALFIDQRLLNEMPLQEWLQTAHEIQTILTDSVIDNAVHKFPEEAFKEIGDKTITILKSRRDQLIKLAYKAYKLQAKDVLIAGSDKDELIHVNRISKFETEVVVLNCLNELEYNDTLYHRVFNSKETSLIKIFGLGGNDTYIMEGEGKIKVELIGGEGDDKYYIKSSGKGMKRKNIIADTKVGRQMYLSNESNVKVFSMPKDEGYYFERSRKRK